ncbi:MULTISPECIES: Nif3-like dinuclear metal center hexameric protein [unclassified Oscillibacter]|uniref:Nif3-like dinuclear metal center hexameric protein n=1 Tax=unclassified Oscillibacter TaxID=2629304 RepID=UPI0025E9FE5D|nr:MULTISPECIES: Nif3-like dinuclear metal center hexameric protein [unclassified Oscillibacter]
MPTALEIEKSLFELAPKAGAMDWDNVGLLVGDPAAEITRALAALDVTEAVADEAIAKGCQLIVSHHPVMNCRWLPVQTLREDTPQGRLLRKLVRANMCVICMHTNLDVAEGGVNDVLAYTLRLEDPGPLPGTDGLARMGRLPAPMALRDFAGFVSQALDCNGVRYADAGKSVLCVAVGGGACGEYADAAAAAGCDTFVTSDLGYHAFLDAAGKGINLLDAGHFPTEDPVCHALIDWLQGKFPGLSIEKSASHREVIQFYIKGE